MSESHPNWISALRHSVTGASVERRREERSYVKFPIEVRVSSGDSYPGFSRDLCRSSMGAVVSTHLKIGQQVWVSYDRPVAGAEPVRVVARQATVRICLGFRYGFEFDLPMEI